MSGPSHSRVSRLLLHVAAIAAFGISVQLSTPAFAQDNAAVPASVPAGVLAARPASVATPHAAVSAHQAHEADDAYLEGAKQLEKNDLVAAEKSFARAVELNPGKQEYVLSLAVVREHRLTELVQQAAKARLLGDNTRADELLAEARTLDPDNNIVTQHLGVDASPLPTFIDTANLRANSPAFDGPIEFAPTPGIKSLHHTGGSQDIIRAVYKDFGITVTFDSSVTANQQLKFDLDDVDFATATHFLAQLTHTFAVPVQPNSALIAKDSPENRDRLAPLIEETVYLPGLPADVMTDMANLARNIFDLKQVTASPTGGDILLRGDENTLRLLNATYADMLDGGSDVLLDIRMYEIDKTHLQNIGASLPSSAGVFSVTAELQTIVSQNQTLINEAISAGQLVLTNNYFENLALEAGVLLASGAVTLPQYSNLLGVFGALGSYTNAAGKVVGVPLAGLFLGSSSTFNLLLNSTDVRMLDEVQIRSGDNQPANFRAGTRYPITTSTYSSGISSSLAASVSNLKINGTSVSSLLSQLGGTSTTVPQIQYEDLGITIKVTPKIQRSGNVSLTPLDMKIEALGSGSLNGIPVLNSRTLTSTITIPVGQTALLASEISRNESRDIDGIPGLSELPGFQGTDKDDEIDSGELLITITPHVVRTGSMRITSRRLAIDHASTSTP